MGSPFKMNPKTPLMKALVGKQGNLPEQLKQAILDAPAKMTDKGKGKSKAKPFVDPGEPAEFKKGTWKGTTESVIRPFEGTAFVGTTGSGKRQPQGKQVSGYTEGTQESEVRFARGKVVGSGEGDYTRSASSSKIKGATIEQKKYKSGKKGSATKSYSAKKAAMKMYGKKKK